MPDKLLASDWEDPVYGEAHTNTMLLKMYMKLQDLMSREEGQDLVEYALLVALVSLASITLIKGVARSVVSIFTTISTTLAGAI
jgi:pilus assembly protein Flp/PilA